MVKPAVPEEPEIDLSEFAPIDGRRIRCRAGIALDALPPERRRVYEAAFAKKEIQTSRIYAKLKEECGTDLGRTSVERHRQGGCACPKGAA